MDHNGRAPTKEISDRRPTNEGVDAATEMLNPLGFFNPKGDDTKSLKRWRESTHENYFFITGTGHMGMDPEKIREDTYTDNIKTCGKHWPRFQVIAPCYINNIMHAEAIDVLQSCGVLVDLE